MGFTTDTSLYSAPDGRTATTADAPLSSAISTESSCVHRFLKDIDLATISEFEAALEHVSARRVAKVVLDLTKVGFIGACGLEMLERYCTEAQQSDLKIALACDRAVERHVRLLEIPVDIYASVDAACAPMDQRR
ncbi:STAS domain-containing protein [Gordonia jinghuaiqii]|uniref:STAS domain-containing protein n=1 Tax=Gordonia jinghuaiqii TaxID=2758710 RepID=A0A7D7RA63_9ACTN|nr:STAS domain-containing protein [Gordonia jinghuaiqii]MCR5978357.1 STAS domain-containing protein [Gordonia jinghuaiqii]QMT01210.1 STAS domain-containing protein [Gordonia jinghuaiqii]